MRSRVLVVLVLVVLAGGCASTPPGTAPSSTPSASAPAPARTEPLAVLHAWDAARAQAWEQDDPQALAGLYVDGAEAGDADVALLARYRARGVRLTGLRMQVLAVRTVVRRAYRLRLVVVERFAGATATSSAGTRQLPVGVPVRRVVELRRPADRWLVASVRTLPREGSR